MKKYFFYQQNVFQKRDTKQTAADLADLTLDDFKTWTTVNLKAFLPLRG